MAPPTDRLPNIRPSGGCRPPTASPRPRWTEFEGEPLDLARRNNDPESTTLIDHPPTYPLAWRPVPCAHRCTPRSHRVQTVKQHRYRLALFLPRPGSHHQDSDVTGYFLSLRPGKTLLADSQILFRSRSVQGEMSTLWKDGSCGVTSPRAAFRATCSDRIEATHRTESAEKTIEFSGPHRGLRGLHGRVGQ